MLGYSRGAEVRIASQDLKDVDVAETEDLPAIPAPFSRPDCGGPLSQIPNPAERAEEARDHAEQIRRIMAGGL